MLSSLVLKLKHWLTVKCVTHSKIYVKHQMTSTCFPMNLKHMLLTQFSTYIMYVSYTHFKFCIVTHCLSVITLFVRS